MQAAFGEKPFSESDGVHLKPDIVGSEAKSPEERWAAIIISK